MIVVSKRGKELSVQALDVNGRVIFSKIIHPARHQERGTEATPQKEGKQ